MEISGLNHKSQSFIRLINVKMSTTVCIFYIYEQDKFLSAELSMKNVL